MKTFFKSLLKKFKIDKNHCAECSCGKADKVEYAYKVVSLHGQRFLSASCWAEPNDPNSVVEYKIGEWAEASPDRPNYCLDFLFVFNTLENAREFVKNYRGDRLVIFLSKVEGLTKPRKIAGLDRNQWPAGTRFASKVKLLREVTDEV